MSPNFYKRGQKELWFLFSYTFFMKGCFQDERSNCYCKVLSILNPENTGSWSASLFIQPLLLLETKQILHLHGLMLILLFLDKSFSKGWGWSTRTEEKGFTVTAVLCALGQLSSVLLLYTLGCGKNQPREREKEISDGKLGSCWPALWLGKIFLKMWPKVFSSLILKSPKVNQNFNLW